MTEHNTHNSTARVRSGGDLTGLLLRFVGSGRAVVSGALL
jgi:hypothetical protein